MPRGPQPGGDTQRRNAPTIETTVLSPGSDKEIPVPPKWAKLKGLKLDWWNWAWGLPEAQLWSVGDTQLVVRLAHLTWATITEGSGSKALAEVRQIEDRLGLSPKAKLDMRIKFAEPDSEPVAGAEKDEVTAKRKSREARRARIETGTSG